MSARPLTDEKLLEIIRVVRECGSMKAAESRLGITRATIQHHLQTARLRFPDVLPETQPKAGWAQGPLPERDYEPPEIVSEDEDLDSVIATLEAEQDRKRKSRASLEWAEFKVAGDEPFALVFVGDPHVDTCEISTLRRHVEIIERTPRMWGVGLGDWANSWVGKLRGQYAFQSMTERNAYRLVRWLLEKEIWWAILLGNHNGGRWHGDGSPLKWMQTGAAIPTQEWQLKFSVACGKASWKIWAAHNFPGNSQFNSNHGPDKRALHTGAQADLFIAGDRHVFKLSEDQHEHTGRTFWSARAKGYKLFDLYPEELGFGGKQTIGHSIGAVFNPRTGRLQCFSDVEEAASYLTFLRGRK